MAAIARPGTGEFRGRGSTPLGNAAASLVGTPRSVATPRSRVPSSTGASALAAGAGAVVSKPTAAVGDRHRRPSLLKGHTASPASNSVSLALVRAMKGTGVESASDATTAIGNSGNVSDSEDCDNQSVCSTSSKLSHLSTLSTMSSSKRGASHGGSTSSTSGSKSIHMSFSSECSGLTAECSISIEQQSALDSAKMSLCLDFRQLCAEGQGDGLMQCLQMNGYEKPNKLQQHAMPAVMHFMGKELGGQTGSAGKGKTCIVMQGPAKSGKTSAVLLSILASIDPALAQPQAILLSRSSKRDFDKLLSVFTLMQSIRYQSFSEEEWGSEASVDERSPEVVAARTAHILAGHPKSMLKLLSSVPALCLDSVKALVIDDVEELLYHSQFDATMESPSSKVVAAAAKAGIGGIEQQRPRDQVFGETNAETPSSTASPLLDDVVQICNVLECRQFSQNMSDTYRIRTGGAPSTKLRYVIVSQPLVDNHSRKALRLLKTSLMKKKNMLGIESIPPPTRIIKAMKHYYAEAPHSEWVRVFTGLVQSLMFPRALIFCDDENIKTYARELQDMGVALSVNLSEDAAGASEARRKAVQDFTSNRTQFLLTRSEPAVCQIVLPKVSSVFHFGLPQHHPSVYGVRLLPLDAANIKDSPSILFVDAPRGGSGSRPQQVKSVGKLFDIDFLDMPFEFLPAQAATSAGGRRIRGRG